MPAEIRLTNDGFVVLDDFGPEGRRPVLAGMGPNGPGVLVFANAFLAGMYADARDRHREHATTHSAYSDTGQDLREEAKRIAREYGRIVDETDELAGLVEPCDA